MRCPRHVVLTWAFACQSHAAAGASLRRRVLGARSDDRAHGPTGLGDEARRAVSESSDPSSGVVGRLRRRARGAPRGGGSPRGPGAPRGPARGHARASPGDDAHRAGAAPRRGPRAVPLAAQDAPQVPGEHDLPTSPRRSPRADVAGLLNTLTRRRPPVLNQTEPLFVAPPSASTFEEAPSRRGPPSPRRASSRSDRAPSVESWAPPF